MPFIADRIFGWKPVLIDESWGLHSIANGHAYSICNTLSCINCGLIFLDIRFTDNEIANLYDNYRNENYTNLREYYEPGYKIRNQDLITGFNYTDKIESFLSSHLRFPVSILDWGGDTGNNTPFKNKNKLFHIYDISQKDVIVGAKSISKTELLCHSYDLIVCSNVLEHVPYPDNLLTDIKFIMNKNTVLYIEVPFEKLMQDYSPSSYLRKKHWHEHINFFSEKSIATLTKNIGLNIIKINKLDILAENKSATMLQIMCKISD
jgi:hypothetical protein